MVSFDSAALWIIGECLEWRVTLTFTSAPDALGEQISAVQTYPAPQSEKGRS